MAGAYLFAPAYALETGDQHPRALETGRWLAAGLGLDLVASPLLDRRCAPGAGTWLPADERVADLQAGLGHRLLLAARGGYGCMDLVAPLLAASVPHPPRLVGYSDLTVLHACWWVRGWGETVYGLLAGVAHGPRARVSTLALLRGEPLAVTDAACPDAAVLAGGAARGPCFAGCLRVLAGLAGTPAMPDLRGCIVALEDVDERPYRVDRDLHQLHLAGALDGVAGLVFGRFPAQLPATYAGPSTRDLCAGWARRLGVPAVFGLPIGHDPDPLSLACGRQLALDCRPDGWGLAFAPAPGLAGRAADPSQG